MNFAPLASGWIDFVVLLWFVGTGTRDHIYSSVLQQSWACSSIVGLLLQSFHFTPPIKKQPEHLIITSCVISFSFKKDDHLNTGN
jgi:hypothetical protein